LEAEQKATKIALSKELRNNHGKVVKIEQLHWAAVLAGNLTDLPQDSISCVGDNIQINSTNKDRQAATSGDRILSRELEISWSPVPKVEALQDSEALLEENPDHRRPSCEIDPEASEKDVNSLKITKSTTRKHLTPPEFLARWLDSREDSERYFSNEIYWEETKYSSALPTILVEYMYRSEHPQPVCTQYPFSNIANINQGSSDSIRDHFQSYCLRYSQKSRLHNG
jgi:hypothetical protein